MSELCANNMFWVSRYFVLSAVWWAAAAVAQLAHLLSAKDSCGLAVLLCASDSPASRISFGAVVCCKVGTHMALLRGVTSSSSRQQWAGVCIDPVQGCIVSCRQPRLHVRMCSGKSCGSAQWRACHFLDSFFEPVMHHTSLGHVSGLKLSVLHQHVNSRKNSRL